MRMTEAELQNYQQRQARNTRQAKQEGTGGPNGIKRIQGAGGVRGKGLQREQGTITNPVEEVEQVALARYLDMKGVRFHHSPNGGLRNVIVAKKLKAAGCKPGFPDIIIIDQPPNYPEAPGAVIELKRVKGGKLSEDQSDWLQHFESHGWCCCVARGASDAIRFLRSLGW